MISQDDARVTLELPDRYVIEPLFDFWNRTHYVDRGAKPVEENFVYASNTNSHYLTVGDIRNLRGKGQVNQSNCS